MDLRFIVRGAHGGQEEEEEDEELPYAAVVVKSNGPLPCEISLDNVVAIENAMARAAWRKPDGSLPEAHLAGRLAAVELVFTVPSAKRKREQVVRLGLQGELESRSVHSLEMCCFTTSTLLAVIFLCSGPPFVWCQTKSASLWRNLTSFHPYRMCLRKRASSMCNSRCVMWESFVEGNVW